ncbi:hypothetical protein ACO0LV_03875 [Pseudactinotalea sp. Z1739]|uniref:hypothetical protein n=1 Tax=Pseudactinotalea sp. Z1739 TaxID=3413028 RepID=UPI003C7EB081
MGWDREQARQVKAQAADYVTDLVGHLDVTMAHRYGGSTIGTIPGPATVGIALGLAPAADGSYRLALRYRLGTPTARMAARRLSEQFGPDLDVRHTGRVRAWPGPALAGVGLPRSIAAELTERTRPLRPGLSVAHTGVSAGTLGAFVRHEGAVHVLSNHHVLVGEAGTLGDPVVQPGPADGGTDPADRIGALAGLVDLVPGQVATVDAAIAALEPDLAAEAVTAYPGGELTGTTQVDGGEQVAKIGRTTGLTHGVVTAIELDGLLVDFGPGLGTLAFDGQIEVEGTGADAFSAGGDSGSLVYLTEETSAVGLLFAGSTGGGSAGQGLTFLNPIQEVLTRLDVSLLARDDGAQPAAPDRHRGEGAGP